MLDQIYPTDLSVYVHNSAPDGIFQELLLESQFLCISHSKLRFRVQMLKNSQFRSCKCSLSQTLMTRNLSLFEAVETSCRVCHGQAETLAAALEQHFSSWLTVNPFSFWVHCLCSCSLCYTIIFSLTFVVLESYITLLWRGY